MKVVYHPESVQELEQAALWIENQRSGWGFRFTNAVIASVDRLREYPEAGALLERHVRKTTVRSFPFQVVYVYREELSEVVILAIAHSRRRPGYWAGRLSNP